MSRMRNPPHPGMTLRDDVLPALGLSVTDAADALGVTRVTFSRVINGKAGISPEMALRVERWLGVDHGGRAEVWLRMQAAYDLAVAGGGLLATGAGVHAAAMTYFSLATITTTGYGDIVPMHPFARSLANLEAVFGQLFLATFLARLVALHLAQSVGQGRRATRPTEPVSCEEALRGFEAVKP